MTTNTFQVIDMVTREALEILKAKLGFGNRVLRQYDSSFGDAGAKIGDTLRIRIPPRYTVGTGPAPTLQNFTQNQVPVAAQSQLNVALEVTSKDMSLSMDNLKDQLVDPAMAQLAASIDLQGTATVVSSVIATGQYAGNYTGFTNLNTPGNISATTGPASWTGAILNAGATTSQQASLPFFNAQARLTNQSAPGNDRFCVLNPNATANSVAAFTNIFNPSSEISAQYRDGYIGQLAGAMFHTSNTTQSFTSGAWTQSSTVQVSTTSVDGATTLVVKGFGASDTVLAGDQFVVAGVFEVNPLTRQSTSQQQVFTVISTPTNNGSGGFTFNVAPKINSPTSAQYQTVGSLPAANALITMMGTSNTSTAVNFMYQKGAVVMVSAPLENVADQGAYCVTVGDPEDGVSLRYIRQYQASIGQTISSIDTLVGWAVPRPELGTRIQA
jgi:hypothetical protein